VEPEAAAFVPPTRPAGQAGPVYFAVADRGIVRLLDGKFTLLGNSPGQLVKGLQVGGDGAVWVVGFQEVLRLDGDKFRKISEAGYSEIGGTIDEFAVTAGGEVWAATFKGVSHYARRKKWTTEEKAKIGAGDDLLAGIAVDGAGRVWVASTHKLHLRENGAWRDVDVSKAGASSMLFFESLKLAPDESVYALASTALLHVSAAGVVTKVPLGGRSIASYGRLALASGGSLAARDGDNAIVWPAGGSSRVYESRDGKDFAADNIKAVAADDSGRVWVASELGVAILGPGDAKTEWTSGTVPELVGEVSAILVVGAGPATLPAAGPLRKGGLTGKVLSNGARRRGCRWSCARAPT
jgi:ligand-binding sensor domain-containing protein